MKIIRSAIIEDEPRGTQTLLSLIKENHPDVRVSRFARTVAEAKEALIDKTINLFFADIELLDGNIFEALDTTTLDASQHIVFITAYSEYGVQAFNYPTIHYLMKPISPVGLAKAIARYKEAHMGMEAPRKSIDPINKFERDKILLPTQNGATFIDVDTILRIQSANKYSIVFTSDKKQHIVSKPLLRFEELLVEKGFIRVHDSHLINIYQITTYMKGKGGEVVMSDGSHVPISSRRKDMLSELLKLTL